MSYQLEKSLIPPTRPNETETEVSVISRWDFPTILLFVGLVAMALQFVQIAGLPIYHVWFLPALGLMFLSRSWRFSPAEIVAFCAFACVTVIFTMQDYPRTKSAEQLLKFLFIYPGFYLIGRWLGWKFRDRKLPIGYKFLFVFLIFQYFSQHLSIPVIYQGISFGEGALHGTFRERNWFATYFLLLSYVCLLKDGSNRQFFWFLLLNGIVMILSGSKTAFIGAGLIFIFQSKLPFVYKLIPLLVGAAIYASVFSDELSGDKLNVKLEEERGLAYQASIELIEKNPVGYGLGFVESYFGSNSIQIIGLGEGTNSVFSVPLDLMIISGPVGLAFWLVIFAGVGNGAIVALAPIAALSLLNPMHQAESVYFFIGFIVSLARHRNASMKGFKWREI